MELEEQEQELEEILSRIFMKNKPSPRMSQKVIRMFTFIKTIQIGVLVMKTW